MLRGFVLLSFALSCAWATPSANQYIDNVIHNGLPTALRSLGLDPVQLAPFTVGIAPATAQFSPGNATGLGRARRMMDCSGPKLFRNELTINCTLVISPIATAYTVSIVNASRVVRAKASGSVGDTRVSFIIAGQAPYYVGSVKAFSAGPVGQISPVFANLPPAANRYVPALQSAYRTNVSTQLYNVLQQRFVYALGRAVSNVPMPRQ